MIVVKATEASGRATAPASVRRNTRAESRLCHGWTSCKPGGFRGSSQHFLFHQPQYKHCFSPKVKPVCPKLEQALAQHYRHVHARQVNKGKQPSSFTTSAPLKMLTGGKYPPPAAWERSCIKFWAGHQCRAWGHSSLQPKVSHWRYPRTIWTQFCALCSGVTPLGQGWGPDEPLWSLPAWPILWRALQWQHPLLTGGQWGLIASNLNCEFLLAGTHCSSVMQMLSLGFSPSLVGLCLEWFKTSLFTSSITKERFGNVENMRPLWKRGTGFWRTQAPFLTYQISSSPTNRSSHFYLMPI